MKVLAAAVFAGLSFVPLAAASGMEGSCVAGDCPDSGNALLQRDTSLARGPGPEESLEGAGEGHMSLSEAVANSTDATSSFFCPWWSQKNFGCHWWNLKRIESEIAKAKEDMHSMQSQVASCVKRMKPEWTELEKRIEYLKKLIKQRFGNGGQFVEEGASEGEVDSDVAFERPRQKWTSSSLNLKSSVGNLLTRPWPDWETTTEKEAKDDLAFSENELGRLKSTDNQMTENKCGGDAINYLKTQIEAFEGCKVTGDCFTKKLRGSYCDE